MRLLDKSQQVIMWSVWEKKNSKKNSKSPSSTKYHISKDSSALLLLILQYSTMTLGTKNNVAFCLL